MVRYDKNLSFSTKTNYPPQKNRKKRKEKNGKPKRNFK